MGNNMKHDLEDVLENIWACFAIMVLLAAVAVWVMMLLQKLGG